MTRRVRTSIFGCSAIALIMLASACSSGSEKVSVGPTTTRAGDSSATHATSSTSKAKKAAAPKTAKRKTKKRATTSTTRGGRATPGASTANTTTAGGVYVPLATTAPTYNTAPPTTATPTTARHTPTTVCIPKPYDPTKAIDLGCTPRVTPAEQARAEQLIRDTLRDLPHYANPNTAYSEGYRSIGDAVTGDEHYIKWAYLTDGRILDSKHPESLVYEMRNGKETLVAAMYMLELGSTFADVPDVGGPLTQWHVHNNLCLVDDPNDPLRKFVSLASNGICPPGSSKATATPMIHVWIVKNACGPFASLEGIGAGQVPPGETRDCDTAHGSR
jgi:hypothetical protein